MNRLWLILLPAILWVGCVSEAPPNTPLFPIQRDGRWGYASRDGHLWIKPQFEAADPFSEGLARVRSGGREGFINRKGLFVVQPIYFQVRGFSDGLAQVTPVQGLASNSLVNRMAGTSAPAQRAPVQFIGPDGALALTLPAELPEAGDFHEGLACVKGDYAWGFIDKHGSKIIDRFSNQPADFHEGLAVIARGPPNNVKYGFGDNKGQDVIPPTFEAAQPFSEGLAAVKYGGIWQFIDRSGAPVIAKTFQKAEAFSEGRAAVIHTLDWCYVDKNGQVVLPGPYQQAGRFNGTDAVVRQNNAWKIIDTHGTAIDLPSAVEPADVRAGFVDGLLPVHEGHKLGYVRPDGSYAWSPSN